MTDREGVVPAGSRGLSPERLAEWLRSFPTLHGDAAADALDRLARIERLMREPGFRVEVCYTDEWYATTSRSRSPMTYAPTAWEATCALADALAAQEGE